ncbi:MAG: hypothetical protein IT320_20795 [Anaerolineae bacterium]|nr:hypothetical protein [Anaerolineae bacterium]
MRVAREAGADLDEADGYQRVHGLAAIHKAAVTARDDTNWWTRVDWHDEPPRYSREWMEINEGARIQVLMLVRPTETAALARIERQTRALRQVAVDRAVDDLRDKKNGDARELWREAWQEATADAAAAEQRIDAAIAEALNRRDINRFAPLYTVWVAVDALMREWEHEHGERQPAL